MSRDTSRVVTSAVSRIGIEIGNELTQDVVNHQLGRLLHSMRGAASAVSVASCARRGTPSSSVFAPASDERVSVLPFPALASGQITPTPRLFASASSKKAPTLPFHGSIDGQKNLARGVRSFGIGAKNSGAEQKSISAAVPQLHRRTKKPHAPSPELRCRSRKLRGRSSPVGAWSKKPRQRRFYQ